MTNRPTHPHYFDGTPVMVGDHVHHKDSPLVGWVTAIVGDRTPPVSFYTSVGTLRAEARNLVKVANPMITKTVTLDAEQWDWLRDHVMSHPSPYAAGVLVGALDGAEVTQ